MTALWIAVIVASLGCYALKLAGLYAGEAVLSQPRVQRIATLLPVAMLAALVTVQLLDRDGSYHIDWRTLAGVGAGAIALLLRRGFLVVLVTAVLVTALLRLLT